jgi:hypothetical protein
MLQFFSCEAQVALHKYQMGPHLFHNRLTARLPPGRQKEQAGFSSVSRKSGAAFQAGLPRRFSKERELEKGRASSRKSC